MSELTQLSKVVMVVETSMEREVLEKACALGARGYTCIHCLGRGKHHVYDDPWAGSSQIRIEIVTSRRIGEALLKYLHEPHFENRAVAVYLEPVEVVDPEHFVSESEMKLQAQ